jgi:hypothetical protein
VTVRTRIMLPILVSALAAVAVHAQLPAMSSHGGGPLPGAPTGGTTTATRGATPAAPAAAAGTAAAAPAAAATGAPAAGAAPAPSPSLGAQVQHIFATRCTTCHGGPAPLGGLALDQGRARAQLVGVASIECSSAPRVVPGKPDASYLMMKLTGSGACFVGAQMPMGASIPPAEVDVVRKWIAAGAPPA